MPVSSQSHAQVFQQQYVVHVDIRKISILSTKLVKQLGQMHIN